jgi:hypothetical protein
VNLYIENDLVPMKEFVMKFPVIFGIALLSIYSPGFASVTQNCPDLNGRYSIHSTDKHGIAFIDPVFVDASKLFKLNLINVTSGEVEIRGDARQGLSFFWKTERDGVMPISMPISANSEWKFSRDYKCEDGWVIFSRRSPAFRNDLPGAYEGEAKIRLARDDLYDGLKIESTFSGHELVSLFSYDSAHIDFPKWWSRKTLRDSIVLSTAIKNIDSVDPSRQANKQATKSESQAVANVRQLFNEKLLGGLMLGWVEDHEGGVTVTLKALNSSDIKPFEDRLRAAAIPYQMKTEPIWTNNSYFLELLVKTTP